jgi:hypothetical protein
MGSSVYVFAAQQDNERFCEFASSLGLRIYPILMEQPELAPSDDPGDGPFCWLSPLARGQLHPYGKRPGIGDATDPLIEYMRPYFRAPDLLVIGRVYCSSDVKELHVIRKPYFSKLAKWIRSHWQRLPTGQYIGPEAMKLKEGGVKLAYFPPGVNVDTKIVG